MNKYKVTAPLVVAADHDGRNHHCYQGSIIRWLNDKQRAHFLRLGLVEEITETPAAAAVDVDADETPEPAASTTKPAKTAPVEKWAEYGASLGHDRDELLALGKQNKQELIDLLLG